MKLSALYEDGPKKIATRKQVNIKKQVSDTVPRAGKSKWMQTYADDYSMTSAGADSKLLPQYRGKGLA
jgi:hypothetical protein